MPNLCLYILIKYHHHIRKICKKLEQKTNVAISINRIVHIKLKVSFCHKSNAQRWWLIKVNKTWSFSLNTVLQSFSRLNGQCLAFIFKEYLKRIMEGSETAGQSKIACQRPQNTIFMDQLHKAKMHFWLLCSVIFHPQVTNGFRNR